MIAVWKTKETEMELTTQQIIDMIDLGDYPTWGWEVAAESAAAESFDDAKDGARFLEEFQPCRVWSAAEYHGLMHHHFTGRWPSVLDIAHIRLGEKHEDMKEKYADNPAELARIEAYYGNRAADDALAVKWLHDRPDTHVYDCADGTVLTFNGIFGGIIDTEEPD